MGKLLSFTRNWAEKLTLNIIGLFPKVKPETIQKLKDAYNKHEQNIDTAVDDLKASDPTNISDWLGLHGLFKSIKPLVIIGIFALAAYFGFKLYKRYRRR